LHKLSFVRGETDVAGAASVKWSCCSWRR